MLVDSTAAPPLTTSHPLNPHYRGVSAWWGLVAAFSALLIVLASAGHPQDALQITAAAAAAALALAFGAKLRGAAGSRSFQDWAIVLALAMSAAFEVGAAWVMSNDGVWPPPGWTLVSLLIASGAWFVASAGGLPTRGRAVALTEALLPGSVLAFAALYAIPNAPQGGFVQNRAVWIGAGITTALGFAASSLRPTSIGAIAATLGSAGVLLGLLGDSTVVVVLGNSAFVAAGLSFLTLTASPIEADPHSPRDLNRTDLLLAPALVLLALVAILLRGDDAGARQAALRTSASAALALLVARQIALLWQQRRELALLNAAHRELSIRATLDALTQLPNRDALLTRLDEEVERARRHDQALSLCFVDIDYFKAVNDRLGHAVGDECLRAVANILRRTARSIDIVGRYGGEEFLVVAPGTQLDEAVILGERIRLAVERATMTLADGQTLRLTISVGLAEFPRNAESLDGLIVQSDAALYASKRAGRNQVTASANKPGI